jgi:hypothetical protein
MTKSKGKITLRNSPAFQGWIKVDSRFEFRLGTKERLCRS